MAKTGGIILAAGRGSRMGSAVPKQFLTIHDRPLFLYSVETFLRCVDQVLIVTSGDAVQEVTEIIDQYFPNAAVQVCEGGAERYLSSQKGLSYMKEHCPCDYVLIHDAARAAISKEVIERVVLGAKEHGAAIAAVPVKDTIKISDESGFVKDTPPRDTLWSVQTPQGFSMDLIWQAYEKLMAAPHEQLGITDDSMVVEQFSEEKIFIAQGDYSNVKITTPEDLIFLEKYLEKGEA